MSKTVTSIICHVKVSYWGKYWCSQNFRIFPLREKCQCSGVFGPYSVRMWEITDQNNFEYGHFSRRVLVSTPAKIYQLKVDNGNTKKMHEICSKLTVKTPERRHWRCSIVFVVNFENIAHPFLVFLCWLWKIKFLLWILERIAVKKLGGIADKKFQKIYHSFHALVSIKTEGYQNSKEIFCGKIFVQTQGERH